VRIIEIFHSIQGEGPWTGVRTSFVRTATCNLRCTWCDTTYSFGPGTERSLASILAEVAGHRTRHVCLTGGEPLLQPEGPQLVRSLSEGGYTVVVETGGSLDIRPYLGVPRVHVSLDVKLPSSRMEGRMLSSNWAHLRPEDVVKMVIADRADYEAARGFLEREPVPCEVIFQPVWGTPAGRLADWVLADALDVRVMLQEHKVLWGDVPGR
jgi:7-carboxy-7-deazaguanine synthase